MIDLELLNEKKREIEEQVLPNHGLVCIVYHFDDMVFI